MALFKRRKKEEIEKPEFLPLESPQRLEAVAATHKKEKEEAVAKPWIESETELFKRFWAWMWQARTTMILILLTIAMTILFWLLIIPEGATSKFLFGSFFRGESYISPLAALFAHGNLAHLLGNMLFLLMFGRIAERKFGGPKMLLLYFGAGILSSLISDFFGQTGIGASGAISGLTAIALLLYPLQITYAMFGIPLPIVMVGWFQILDDAIGILFPVPGDPVGHIAHLGGSVSILLLLAFILRGEYKRTVGKGLLINIPFAILMLILLVSGLASLSIVIVALALLGIILWRERKRAQAVKIEGLASA